MTKLKLLMGTYNSIPPGSAHEQLEKIYQNSYKPFLQVLYEFPKVKASLHYSGVLFEWLEEYHSELFIIINEMIKRRQIELLGGGFYDPILPVIPGKDRLNQIEMLTTYIRKRFGRRPRGYWLTERVWEPHICSSIKSSGMNYIFLEEQQFRHAGLEGSDVYTPCYTEDQGKVLAVIPVHTAHVSSGWEMRPESFLESLLSSGIPHNGVFCLMYDGQTVQSEQKLRWFKDLFTQLTENYARKISLERSGDFVRSLGELKKVYFPVSSGTDIEYWAMSTVKQKEWKKYSKKNSRGRNFCSPTGYFRQFFSKYEESNFLYSRMLYTHDLVSQIRNDKSRKKSASEEILKSQGHYPYWHGNHPGIYDSAARQHVYQSLINAEKNIREKGVFTTHLQALDFDMDGGDEYVYHGQYINAYVHKTGARLFELDYMISPWNYLNTMKRYSENYHSDEEARFYVDHTERGAFIDRFLPQSVTETHFQRHEYRDKGNFASGIYSLKDFDREHKELVLEKEGEIGSQPVSLEKRFKFRKNLIEVTYRLINKGTAKLDVSMATEMDFSFHSPETEDLLVQPKETENITDFSLADLKNKVLISVYSSIPHERWNFPVYSRTEYNGRLMNLYQFNCFVLRWNITLEAEASWENTLAVKLEKK